MNMQSGQSYPLLFRSALLAAIFITLYFAFGHTEESVTEHLNDKVRHVLAFMVLAFLTDFAFPRSPFGARKIGALLALGLFIETVQYFLPHREASFLDLLADSAGVAAYLGVSLQLRCGPFFKGRQQS